MTCFLAVLMINFVDLPRYREVQRRLSGSLLPRIQKTVRTAVRQFDDGALAVKSCLELTTIRRLKLRTRQPRKYLDSLGWTTHVVHAQAENWMRTTF